MKRFLFATMMMMATTAFASENDTLIIEKPQRVIIITSDSLQSIHVKGKEGDNQFDYQNTIQLLDSNYVSTETYNKTLWDLGPSWEFMWDIAHIQIHPWKELGHHFKTGIGLDWRNYRMTDQKRFVEMSDGQIDVTPYPQGSEPDFSRIKVLSLTVPFTYGFYPSRKGFFRGFEVGPVLNFNVYSSIKTRYSVNGENQKDFTKGLHKNPVTVDFMLKLRMRYFGFYAKYSPCNVLDTSYGPKFKSVSFGIYF